MFHGFSTFATLLTATVGLAGAVFASLHHRKMAKVYAMSNVIYLDDHRRRN